MTGQTDRIMSYIADKFDMIGKQLAMSRTPWGSGSCTITDISKYLVVLFYHAEGGDPLIGIQATNGHWRGFFMTAGSTGTQYGETLDASSNGDVLTFVSANILGHNVSGNHSVNYTRAISKVIGLIPKFG